MNRLVPRILLTGTLMVGFSGAFSVGHSLIGSSPAHASMSLAAFSGTCPSLAIPNATQIATDAAATKVAVAAATKVASTAVAAATKAAGTVTTLQVKRTVTALAALTASGSSYTTAKAAATAAFTGTATAAAQTSTAIAAQAKAVLTPAAQVTATTLANWKNLNTYATAAAKVTAAAQKTADAAATIVAGSDTKAITTLHAKQTAVAAVVTPETVKVPPVSAYVTNGCGVTLTVSLNGTPVLPVTWQENTGSTWANVTTGGAYNVGTDINNTLTITPTDTMNGYKYRAIAANNGGGAVSNAAVLRLVPYVSDLGVTTTGSAAGGNSVTIKGTSLLVDNSTAISPTVLFGNIAVPSSSITAATNTQLTVNAPATSVGGPVAVTVNTLGGTSPISSTGTITYTYGPVVNLVTPEGGPADGATKTNVDIFGSGFGANSDTHTVTIGGVAAFSNTVLSDTHINATVAVTSTAVPAAAIVVTHNGVASPTSAATFNYSNAPVVAGVAPNVQAMGGLGRTITITGTNFVAGGSTVLFGDKVGKVTASSPTSITATSPVSGTAATATSQTVDVSVSTVLGGKSAVNSSDKFQYVAAPTITSISPATSPYSTSATIAISGTDFLVPVTGTSPAVSTKCGSIAATSTTVVSSTLLTVICPAHAKVTADTAVTLAVTALGGTSSTSATAAKFTWKP